MAPQTVSDTCRTLDEHCRALLPLPFHTLGQWWALPRICPRGVRCPSIWPAKALGVLRAWGALEGDFWKRSLSKGTAAATLPQSERLEIQVDGNIISA